MSEKRILFGNFEFTRIRGLEYLMDEEKPITDYLFVNEPHDGFSMYFENGFPVFTVPENSERPYCLFEIKRPDRKIKFFCPERNKNLDSVVWYFCVELFDENGATHSLPGQVRVMFDAPCIWRTKQKPQFVEVLENVALAAI